jgi:hypothetical protein
VVQRATNLQRDRGRVRDAEESHRKRLKDRNGTATRIPWETQPDENADEEDTADRTMPLEHGQPIPGFTPGGDERVRANLSDDGMDIPVARHESRHRAQENHPVQNVRENVDGDHEEDVLPLRRPKNPWTDYEVQLLEDGIRDFGSGQWAKILARHGRGDGGFLAGRTSVDLKDKARNEKRRRQRNGEALGGFGRVPA